MLHSKTILSVYVGIMKNLTSRFLVIMGLLVTLPGCSWMSNSKKQSMIVVNVLDKEMYDDCHIAGSIQVPFADVEKEAKNWDKSAKVVIYCSGYLCTASGHAARTLKKMGFTQVWAYEEGMAGWKQAGLPTEGPCVLAYLDLPNEKLGNAVHEDVTDISTQELFDLMKSEGLLQ